MKSSDKDQYIVKLHNLKRHLLNEKDTNICNF